MKNKFINESKSILKSCINNNALFERRKKSFLVPFLTLLLTLFMMVLPSYLSFTNVKEESLMKSFPDITESLGSLLTSDLDCHVKDAKLVCSPDAKQINMVVGDKIKYTIIANQASITTTTDVEYSNPKDTDNLIILLDNFIKIRYVQHDYVNQRINGYEIIGDYTKLEGYSFKEVSAKLSSDPDLVSKEVSSFVLNTYLSTSKDQLIASLSSSFVSFILLILVSCLILRSSNLLKFKKGFKIRECLKITLTSMLPCLFLGAITYLILGIDFNLTFGVTFVVRILYIYFRYIFSNKNNIFDKLYEETKDERFKLK